MTDIQKGRWYTLEEVAKFRDNPEMAGLVMEGYVLQQDVATGMVRFEHWSKAAMDQTKPGNSYGKPVEGIFDKTELPAIVKRTPQQRVDSLMAKVGDDLGHLLSGKEGRVVSGEEVRDAAAAALQVAETEFQKEEDKRIARTTGSYYA